MNLSAKRIGQLLMSAVALFFFSCEDETSLLGYRNPNNKFKVSYVEIPIESSVLLIDSLVTSNVHYRAANAPDTDFPRLLVGSYNDPVFGQMRAEAFAQFRPTISSALPATAEFDSISLQMRFDYYVYGSNVNTTQSFTVHELTESMVFENKSNYFNYSSLQYNPTPIGSNSYLVDFKDFKDEYAEAAPDTATIAFTLDPEFGRRLFSLAKENPDSSLQKPTEFFERFKGISIQPANNTNIVGLSQTSSFSRIRVYYHDATNDSLAVDFVFSSVGNFSKITGDRAATPELSGLITPYTEYLPVSDKRYIQAGTGIITKLDISKFYEFAQADSNKNIIINSAELAVESVETPGDFDPPYSLALLLLEPNNRLHYFKTEQDTIDFISYQRPIPSLQIYDDYGISPVADNTNSFTQLIYSKDRSRYSSLLTLFFQTLYNRRSDQELITKLALYPHATRSAATNAIRYEAGKSVNRVGVHKDNIKLKIFYTKPTINPEQ